MPGAAELQRSKTSYNIASKNCLSNQFLNFFRFFISSLRIAAFQLTGCKTLPNISSFLLLSNQFLTFFRFFISSLRIAAFQLTKCKTSPNISSDFDLSNHFCKKNAFFNSLQKKYALITKNIPCTKCFSMEKSGFRRDLLRHIYRKMH